MAKTDPTQWDSTAANNTDIDGVNIDENCPPGGLNNALRAMMAQIKTYIGGGIATLADWCAGTATNKPVTPSSVLAAVAPQALSDSSAVTVDFSTGLRFTLTKGTNGSMAFTNAKVGYTYRITITQDGTGSRTLSKPTASGVTVKVKGGWPSLSTAAGSVDLMEVYIHSSTLYLITLAKGYS